MGGLNKYDVQITEYALAQMEEIKHYIINELYAPQAAYHLLLEIKKTIASLENLPFRHPLVDEEMWKEKGIRKIFVKNFILYYWIDQEKRIVYVTAVVYDKRDQLAQLNRMPKPKNPKKSKKLDNLGLLSLIQQPLICNIQITLLSIMITLL